MSNFLWDGLFNMWKSKGRGRSSFGRSAKSGGGRSRVGWRRLGFEFLEDRALLHSGPVLTFHTSLGDVKLQLFQDVAPNTVANFMLYVNSGEYDNTIIHRLFDADNPHNGNDIVQGGAVTTSLTSVNNLTTTPLLSERSLSNVRGTIAMALSAFTSGPNAGQTNPDSGTSSFFINTSDNNSSHANVGFDLDAQGFTVFGQVISGMSVVDAMAAATATDGNGFPLVSGSHIVINSVVVDATISGTTFQDFNGDGSNNAGDQGIAGVTVFVDQNSDGMFESGEPSAVSDSNGNYTITGLDPGTYTVQEVVPTGWLETTNPISYSVTVAAADAITGKDFGQILDAPSGIALSADSDTGSSHSDGVTKLNNSSVATELQFTVSGVVSGAVVSLFSDGTQIGQATATGSSVTVTTDGSTSLTDGDHQITATQTLQGQTSLVSDQSTITVDATVPQFTTPPPPLPTSVQAGNDVDYDVDTTEEGNAGFTYSLVGPVPNPGLAIDPATGHITWQTPDASQTGTYAVQVRATDLAGNVAVDPNNNNAEDLTFDLAVTNEAPTINPIPTQNVDQRGTLSVQVNATSPAGSFDVLTYDLDSASKANGASINSAGLITWTLPNSIPPGTTPITVTVTNASHQSSTQTFDVDVAAVNHAPTVTPIANQTMSVGNTLTINVAASDSDVPAQTLTYSLDAGFPSGASINSSTGVLTFTPTQAQNGQTFPITVRVTDNGSPTMSATAAFNVAVNATPVFTPIAPKTVNIGSLLTFTPTVTHVNAITFSLATGAPAGAAINPTTGVFTWTPNAATVPGTFNITLQARDIVANLTGTTVVQVTVVQPNRAPVITTIGDHSVLSGGTLAVQVHATDPDSGQTLTYSFVGGHDGATINATTGLITFHAPTPATVITQSLTVKVTDSGSPVMSASQTFKITTNPTAGANSTVRATASMGVDPLDSTTSPGKALVVNGTEGADIIQLLASNLGDSVIVILNGVDKGTFSLTGMTRLVVNGFAGDDSIFVSKFSVGSIINTGTGNDVVVAGNGNDVILGGPGNDLVFGRGGNKVIIGGGGADQIHGGTGRNILIAGTTSFDADDLALGAILDEWSSADDDSTAMGRLRGTIAGGKNGTNLLKPSTVHRDSGGTQLFAGGDGAFDWIFANLGAAAGGDQLNGTSQNQLITKI